MTNNISPISYCLALAPDSEWWWSIVLLALLLLELEVDIFFVFSTPTPLVPRVVEQSVIFPWKGWKHLEQKQSLHERHSASLSWLEFR